MSFQDSHNLTDRMSAETSLPDAPLANQPAPGPQAFASGSGEGGAATPHEASGDSIGAGEQPVAETPQGAAEPTPATPAEQPAAAELQAEQPQAELPEPEAAEPEAAEPAAAESQPEQPYVERPPVELAEPEPEAARNWYILKVQSNREESIRDGLMRRVKVAGLEDYFGDIIVPTETVTEFKNGKKRIVKRKLYPGYIVVNMAITDDTWFLVRETPGIGDFTGAAGKPTPMLPEEIAKIEQKEKAVETEQPTLSIAFKPGDNVKINEGTFENFEGEVSAVDATNGRITVMINIFGRSTPVELEYWQVESV